MQIENAPRTVLIITNDASNPTIEFDAAEAVQHMHEAKPMNWPVEDGTVITDHRVIDPIAVQVSGVISNTPMRDDVLPLGIPPDSSRAVFCWNLLVDIQHYGREVSIVTALNVYPRMILNSLSSEQTKDTIGGLKISATFSEIRTVSTASVQVRKVWKHSKKKPKPKGPVATTDTVAQATATIQGAKQRVQVMATIPR